MNAVWGRLASIGSRTLARVVSQIAVSAAATLIVTAFLAERVPPRQPAAIPLQSVPSRIAGEAVPLALLWPRQSTRTPEKVASKAQVTGRVTLGSVSVLPPVRPSLVEAPAPMEASTSELRLLGFELPHSVTDSGHEVVKMLTSVGGAIWDKVP